MPQGLAGRGQASHPVGKRERFETETHRRHRRVVAVRSGRPPDDRRAAGVAIGRERPASPVPAARHRPAAPRTRRMSDTKHRFDIGSRTPACRCGRDDRAPQCVASRPRLAPLSATLRVG
ncbi:hypothetical protein [Burkholderia cepacia]|uniref:hypothetical protein n=1 Tax=Burkholderia cepacia TaxID=292 RepID=UPI00054F20FC|nr:hypothetical protein [Burkholderia cepacia]KWE55374.1 hypothetical protein WT53_23560 [Burkholderia sp. MSMB2157WGS]